MLVVPARLGLALGGSDAGRSRGDSYKMTAQEMGVDHLRDVAVIVVLTLLIGPTHCMPQEGSNLPNLNTYFKQYVGLTDDQITAIRGGKPIAKNLRSRTPAEIFVFGAVYVNATPDSYVNFSTDFDRLRKLSGYLAIN